MGVKMDTIQITSGGNGTFGNVLRSLKPRERRIESDEYFAVDGQPLRSKRVIRGDYSGGSLLGRLAAELAATDCGVLA
jgi:hypothetical protein